MLKVRARPASLSAFVGLCYLETVFVYDVRAAELCGFMPVASLHRFHATLVVSWHRSVDAIGISSDPSCPQRRAKPRPGHGVPYGRGA